MQIFSYSQEGYDGHIITIEVDVRNGIPNTIIVGLAGHAIQESRERVRISLKNSGFVYPDNRIVINLSPASLPKSGTSFDLAIAFSLLAHTEQIGKIDRDILLLGELHLDGRVDAVPGIISAVHEGLLHGIDTFIVPSQNYDEARVLQKGIIISILHLSDFRHIHNAICDARNTSAQMKNGAPAKTTHTNTSAQLYSLSHIIGHTKLKRVMEIAIVGNHHTILIGAPGSGKTLSAQVMSTLMSPLTVQEAIETTRLHSMAGMLSANDGLIATPPFRAPHHSVSYAGMLGGGDPLLPGEIALAHNGILLLDETLEFRRDVLQGLRQPLEEREIRVSRAQRYIRFPSDFLLIMTANVCPCGNFGKKNSTCFCKLDDIKKYWKRLGGAFLDRIPLRYMVHSEHAKMSSAQSMTESTDTSHNEAYTRIHNAVEIQRERYAHINIRRNGHLRANAISRYCVLSESQIRMMNERLSHHQLSNRALHILCTIARTIADLDSSERIQDHHLTEALDLRIGNTYSETEYEQDIIGSLLG